MQLPTLKKDYWELVSGEAQHEQYPDTFWIPPAADRKNLKIGQAAKLIFDIEFEDEEGALELFSERMWVIVSEIREAAYIGILDNSPATFDPSDEDYLCFGAEIPFKPEHVIGITHLPEEYVKQQLSQPPKRKWPRT